MSRITRQLIIHRGGKNLGNVVAREAIQKPGVPEKDVKNRCQNTVQKSAKTCKKTRVVLAGGSLIVMIVLEKRRMCHLCYKGGYYS